MISLIDELSFKISDTIYLFRRVFDWISLISKHIKGSFLYLIQIFFKSGMSLSRVEQLKQENTHLKEKIALFKNHQNSGNLKGEI